MLQLYKVAINLYGWVVFLLSGSNEKARKFIEGRRNWEQKLKSDLADNSDPVIWVHASSLGEFEQGRPIIEAVRKEGKKEKILLTFFSPSGYEVRKNYELVDWVHYLPLDTPKRAKAFVEIVRPKVVLFIKYEFWFFILKELVSGGIPVIFVSAVFRKNQLFLHWSGGFFRPVLKKIHHFFVQDERSMELITPLSSNVTVASDTRFDRVIAIAQQAKTYELVTSFLQDKKCFMIGSSWSSDMKVLLPVIFKYHSQMKFIIAPHNIRDEEIAILKDELPESVLYSNPQNIEEANVLIIDNIGMLSSLYKYATYTFIGGGFRGALHNTLEAAVFGMPIFFGRHDRNQKFREAIELEKEGGAFPVNNAEELDQEIIKLENDATYYDEVSNKSSAYVQRHGGATKLIMQKLDPLI